MILYRGSVLIHLNINIFFLVLLPNLAITCELGKQESNSQFRSLFEIMVANCFSIWCLSGSRKRERLKERELI